MIIENEQMILGDKMSQTEKTDLIVKIARLYYEHDMSQRNISERLGLSRPYISKLLIEGKRRGIIEIKILDPHETETSIEIELRQKFNLKKAVVIPHVEGSTNSVLHRLALAAARFLDTIVSDNDVIGVTWGMTLYELSKSLISREDLKDITVVQLSGGISKIERNTFSGEILKKFADAYKGTPYMLQLPAVVDSEEVRGVILKDKNISNVLDIGVRSNISIFTMGTIGYDSALARAEYISHREVDRLLAEGAVGDLCCRFIDINGAICDKSLNSRTIGIELSDLKNKEYRIAIATGQNKVMCMFASLRGRYPNVLITDELNARELISLSERIA